MACLLVTSILNSESNTGAGCIRAARIGGTREPVGVSVARYRKKPVVIEAVQVAAADYSGNAWNGSLFKCDVLPQWLEDAFTNGTIAVHPSDRGYALLAIKALEGTMIAEPGDWIIRGVKGELYPCKPEIFEATYEPVLATSFKTR